MQKVYAVMFVLGLFIFFMGWHDVDNAYNLKPGEVDRSLLTAFPKDELHMLGEWLLFVGCLLMSGAYILGVINCETVEKVQGNQV